MIRGRKESVTKASQLLAQVLKTHVPVVAKVSYPSVLFGFLTRAVRTPAVTGAEEATPATSSPSPIDALRRKHATVVSNVDLDRATRTVSIIGKPGGTATAVAAVAGDLEATIKGCVVRSVPVPSNRAGSVIGPKGKTIQELQSETKTDIDLDRQEGMAYIFSAEGSATAVQDAEDRIVAIRDAPREGGVPPTEQ